MKLLCSTKLPSLITAIGALPILLYAVMPIAREIPAVFAQLYVYGVISFIAGINWITALKTNDYIMLFWSILISTVPVFFFILIFFLKFGPTFIWVMLIIILWLSLIYDFFNRKKFDLKYFFCFRRSGTIFLTISIILAMVLY